MSAADVLGPLAGIVLGGGFVSAVVAFKKAPAEKDSIIVNTVKEVVIIQKGALEDATARYDELERRFELLAVRMDKQAEDSVTALKLCDEERIDLLNQNEELIRRLGTLEREVARLKFDTKPIT